MATGPIRQRLRAAMGQKITPGSKVNDITAAGLKSSAKGMKNWEKGAKVAEGGGNPYPKSKTHPDKCSY